MRNQARSIKNIFVNPRFQLRVSLYYIILGGLILSVAALIVLNQLDEVQALMNNVTSVDYQTQIRVNEMLLESLQMSFAAFAIFIVFSFIFAVIVSHRIAGPQLAILAYISQLKEGNYEQKRGLRTHDELTEIMDALENLALVLKNREANG